MIRFLNDDCFYNISKNSFDCLVPLNVGVQGFKRKRQVVNTIVIGYKQISTDAFSKNISIIL